MKFRISYIKNGEYKTVEVAKEELPKYKHLGEKADEIEKMATFLLERESRKNIVNPRTGLMMAVI